MAKLTALAVKNAKPGRHGDGAGLYLLVKPSGAKSWVLRVQKHGKRRDIGLGSLAALTLAEARERAADLRKHALNGRDPVAERDRDNRPTPSFREATIETHAALKPNWVEKNAAAFLTSLETYAHPKLGDLRVDSVEAAHILSALPPIWIAKPEVARKVRMRIGQVLNFAHSKGWRLAEAPTKAVSLGLPKQPKGRNFAAMPYEQVPEFVASLQKHSPTAGRRALVFLILTAARPGEVRFAQWAQIDLAKGNWNRPAEMMKEREAHSITLNAAAIALLKELQATHLPSKNDLIFPGARGKPLSDMTMRKVLRDAGLAFDAHGFRSSFRDWAAEQMPTIPDAVAEAALAHAVPDKIVRAYRRTKFVSMRRQLLEAWGAHIFEEADIEQS